MEKTSNFKISRDYLLRFINEAYKAEKRGKIRAKELKRAIRATDDSLSIPHAKNRIDGIRRAIPFIKETTGPRGANADYIVVSKEDALALANKFEPKRKEATKEVIPATPELEPTIREEAETVIVPASKLKKRDEAYKKKIFILLNHMTSVVTVSREFKANFTWQELSKATNKFVGCRADAQRIEDTLKKMGVKKLGISPWINHTVDTKSSIRERTDGLTVVDSIDLIEARDFVYLHLIDNEVDVSDLPEIARSLKKVEKAEEVLPLTFEEEVEKKAELNKEVYGERNAKLIAYGLTKSQFIEEGREDEIPMTAEEQTKIPEEISDEFVVTVFVSLEEAKIIESNLPESNRSSWIGDSSILMKLILDDKSLMKVSRVLSGKELIKFTPEDDAFTMERIANAVKKAEKLAELKKKKEELLRQRENLEFMILELDEQIEKV